MGQHCENYGRWEPLRKIAGNHKYKSKRDKLDFPGGAVDKNVPADAGAMAQEDSELSPRLRKIPHAGEQLSLCTTTTEPGCHSYWNPSA